MIKKLFKIKDRPQVANNLPENHVESFNRLQCRDIGRAPDTAFNPCGLAQKHLGSPAILFPFKRHKEKKSSKENKQLIESWLKLVKTMSEFGAKGQIAGINNFINAQVNVAPIAAYGKANKWATPARYFSCEDHSENYAIAKYLSLRLLGFHSERLRVVWLRSKGRNSQSSKLSQHVVLMVKLADQTFVLDSRLNKITTDDMLQKEQPICSLNGSQFSVHWNTKTPNGAKKAVAQLTRHAKQLNKVRRLSTAA